MPVKRGYFVKCRKNDDNHRGDDCHDAFEAPVERIEFIFEHRSYTFIFLYLVDCFQITVNSQSRPNGFVEIENGVT